MEVSLLCLMECAHSNPKELQSYEAESEGCYEGSVADALKLILCLSVRKDKAMKSLGGSFSELCIQDDSMLADSGSEDTPIADARTEDAPKPVLAAAKSDPIAMTPKKRGAMSIADDLAEDAPEPLLVLSPSRRVCGKQRQENVSMVYRRNAKYCQAPDCVFSRSMPGQPAWSREVNCVWCDPAAMARALEGGESLMHVRMSLSIFEQKNNAVYERAMAQLPADFSRSAESYMLCQNIDCVFSTSTSGGRAYSERPLCFLCDPKTLLVYGTEEHVRKRVNTILNRLQTKNLPGYEAAAPLFKGSLRSARLCQNPDCCYSLTQPGQRARASNGIYCFWCDADAVWDAHATKNGLRRLFMGINAFRDYPEILSTAHSKLRFDLESYRERRKRQKRELRSKAKEDVEAHRAADRRRERRSMAKEDLVEVHQGCSRHCSERGLDLKVCWGQCAVCGHQCPYYCKDFEECYNAYASEFVTHASRCKLELLRHQATWPASGDLRAAGQHIRTILRKYQDLTGDIYSHSFSEACREGTCLEEDSIDASDDSEDFIAPPCAYQQCMAQSIWTPKLFTRAPLPYEAADPNEERLIDGYQRFLRKHYGDIKVSRHTSSRFSYFNLGDECRYCLRAIVRKLPEDYVEEVSMPKCADERGVEAMDAWLNEPSAQCSGCGCYICNCWRKVACPAYARRMYWLNQPMTPANPYYNGARPSVEALQASEPASEQASRPASQKASQQASKAARQQASKPASKPASQKHKKRKRSEERRVGKECRSRWSPYH